MLRLLEDPEWGRWSDREIARRCHVEPTLVGDVRATLTARSDSENHTRTYTTKHGTPSQIDVSRIGKSAEVKKVHMTPVHLPTRPAATQTPEQRQAANVERDALGEPIPAKLRDAMADTVVATTAALLRRAARQMQQAARSNSWILLSKLTSLLETAAELCEVAVPYAVHPACAGNGCAACRMHGYVPGALLLDLQATQQWVR